jgi:hypothetical protein
MSTNTSATGAQSGQFPQITLDDLKRLKGIIKDSENGIIEPQEFARIYGELTDRYGKDHIREATNRIKPEIEVEQFQAEQEFYSRADNSEFPKAMEAPAYRGIAGEVVKRICHESEICPPAALAHFLSIYGNMLGRGLHKKQAGFHTAMLWPCVVGNTGLARKGVTMRALKLLAYELDANYTHRKFQTGLQTPEALIREIADELRLHNAKGKEYIAIHEVLDKRLIVEEQEMTRIFALMQRPGNQWSEVIRKLYDAPTSIDAKALSNRMTAGYPFVTIIGHITREGLKAKLPSESAFDGLVNRFTFVAAYRQGSVPEPVDVDWQADGNAVVVSYLKGTLDHFRVQADGCLIDGDPDPDSTTLKEWHFEYTPEGREMWRSLYRDLDKQLESTSGINAAIISRSHPTIMRLALIYAALDRKTEIAAEHLESAKAFWDYSARSALWTFGDNSGNREADDVLTALRRARHDGMSLTDITRKVFNNRETFKRDESLSLLNRQGRARLRKVASKGTKSQTRWYAAEFC